MIKKKPEPKEPEVCAIQVCFGQPFNHYGVGVYPETHFLGGTEGDAVFKLALFLKDYGNSMKKAEAKTKAIETLLDRGE